MRLISDGKQPCEHSCEMSAATRPKPQDKDGVLEQRMGEETGTKNKALKERRTDLQLEWCCHFSFFPTIS